MSNKSEQALPVVAVERRFDATALNRVVNHPGVLPWVRGSATGQLDLTAAAINPRNVLLEGEFGSMLFLPTAPGIWEMHTQVLPEGRGQWTLGLATACLRWLFTHTDAAEVLTRVPHGNLGALTAVRRLGWSRAWATDAGWVLDGRTVPATVWSMTLQSWLAGEMASGLETTAHSFWTAAGVDSPAADGLRPIGFLLECIRGRQPLKGVAMVNRWAGVAQQSGCSLLSTEPLVVDLAGALLHFSSDGSLDGWQPTLH